MQLLYNHQAGPPGPETRPWEVLGTQSLGTGDLTGTPKGEVCTSGGEDGIEPHPSPQGCVSGDSEKCQVPRGLLGGPPGWQCSRQERRKTGSEQRALPSRCGEEDWASPLAPHGAEDRGDGHLQGEFYITRCSAHPSPESEAKDCRWAVPTVTIS